MTNRLELIKRTGKIFTARSYHHCNTSKLWVEHKLMKTADFVDGFGALSAAVVAVLVTLLTVCHM